jgi:hypothetical protein
LRLDDKAADVPPDFWHVALLLLTVATVGEGVVKGFGRAVRVVAVGVPFDSDFERGY